jgi:hypothetical protein
MKMRVWAAVAGVVGMAGAAHGQWVTAGSIVYYNSGRVGIGTATPSGQLHVVGATGLGTIRGENTGNGAAVLGWSRAASGVTHGTYGQSHSTQGYGALGWATNTSGLTVGVYGQSDSPTGYAGLFKGGQFGVYGWPTATTGNTVGVFGRTSSPNGWGGIFKGGLYGVWGEVPDELQTTGFAGWFKGRVHVTNRITIGTTPNTWYATPGLEVRTPTNVEQFAILSPGSLTIGTDTDAAAVSLLKPPGTTGSVLRVQHSSTVDGAAISASSSSASSATIYASNGAEGGSGGQFTARGAGAVAVSGFTDAGGSATTAAFGVRGTSYHSAGAGVKGESYFAETVGVSAGGVFGSAVSPNIPGVRGEAPLAVVGVTNSANGRGVIGWSIRDDDTAYGLLGIAPAGRMALFAEGNTGATGTKAFVIDHPLAPADKVLMHYCAEGPEPVLMYRGTAEFDSRGRAEVELPHYFDAIARNAQYQLTAMGAAMPLLHVESGVEDNGGRTFVVAGGAPGKKVCWVVTAERYDEHCRQHPPVVEMDKPEALRGKYYAPELYGKGAAEAINVRVPVGSPKEPERKAEPARVAPAAPVRAPARRVVEPVAPDGVVPSPLARESEK